MILPTDRQKQFDFFGERNFGRLGIIRNLVGFGFFLFKLRYVENFRQNGINAEINSTDLLFFGENYFFGPSMLPFFTVLVTFCQIQYFSF